MADKEYIERGALFEAVKDKSITQFDWSEKVDLEEFEEVLVNIPAADVVEVKRGEWVRDKKSYFYHRYYCSVCGFRRMGEPTKFCEDCGAKMDKM